ncbi:MAG: recombinase family protein [bacterium]
MGHTKESDIVAAGYCRVSTPMQVDGLSLDVQQEQVENYISSCGWKPYRIFVEPGFSAKDSDRPNFQEMLRHLRAGKFDVLVVPKVDRFFRNVRLLLEFVENELKPNDVQLVSVAENIDTTTAAGNTLFQIIGIFAAMERERMAERVTDSMRKKAARGPVGGHRYGYKYDGDGNCRIDPDEAEVVKTIFRLFVKKDMRTTQIADYLRGKEIRSVYGKYMGNGPIKKMLKNEAYIGRFIYGRRSVAGGKKERLNPEEDWIVVERKDLAIISEKTFKAAQRKLNSKKYTRKKEQVAASELIISTHENLLGRGMVKCGKCGANMGNRKWKSRNSGGVVVHHSYYCDTRDRFGRNHCDAKSVSARKIDPVVEERIAEILGSKKYVRTIKSKIKQLARPKTSAQKEEIQNLKLKISKIEQKLDRINELGEETRLVESQARQKAELEKQREQMMRQIADLEREMLETEAPTFDEKLFELLAGNFEKAFDSFSVETKRSVTKAIVKNVFITDGAVTKIEFHPPFDVVEVDI